ncbi:MAG: hypothetical protein HOP17_10735 [Acidobacteria bacterium]|nr:hypothetical protein [Acidobacteriota bacterium]
MTALFAKIKKWHIFAGLVAALFVPIPTEMVPEWRMRFTDEHGNALSNVVVQQSWTTYTYFAGRGYEQRCTDGAGVVAFPQRLLWSGLFARIVSPPLAEVGTLAHGSTGTQADVQVFDRNYISENYWWRDKMDLYTHQYGDLPIEGIANKVDDRYDIQTCAEID